MSACVICQRHEHDEDQPDTCTPRCRRRETSEGQACAQCAQRIRDDLDQILECYALTNTPSTGVRLGGTRSTGISLPGGTDRMNWRASDLHNTLTAWCRDWAQTWNLALPTHPRRGTPVGVVTAWFLRAHLRNALATHPAIADFAREISQLARTGRVLAHLTTPGQTIACPGPGGSGCGQRLRVNIADPDAAHPCRRCGTNWDTAWLLRLAAHVDTPVWVDIEVAARVTGVSERTLRRWAAADRIRRDRGRYELRSIRKAMPPVGVSA